jgi:membrane-associated phospholipid phosphatase
MKQLIKNNLPFFILYAMIWLFGLAIVLTTTKLEQMTYVNQHTNWFGDWFFYDATQLGEGWFFVAMIVLFLFIGYGKSLILAASLALSGLLSSSLKLYFDTLRPMAFFKDLNLKWHYVDGVIINIHQSFPSGHTTTAFALFTIFTLFVKNKNWGYLFITLAWIAGYSRCYLFQHFPVDVLAGSMLGTLSSLVIYYWLSGVYIKKPKDWYERNLRRW